MENISLNRESSLQDPPLAEERPLTLPPEDEGHNVLEISVDTGFFSNVLNNISSVSVAIDIARPIPAPRRQNELPLPADFHEPNVSWWRCREVRLVVVSCLSFLIVQGLQFISSNR